MMSIACASGKGGTGKTTVATNLAAFLAALRPVQLLDCDVEEPNCHLFLPLDKKRRREEVTVFVPEVDEAKCDRCGRCAASCRFNAISVLGDHVLVFPELCHSCGVCSYVCERDAISEVGRALGFLRGGSAGDVVFWGGDINPGEAMAEPVIAAVRAKTERASLNIIDAPPGTTCPTVAAVRGVDLCLLITEPTPFGLSDLDMAVGMCRRLRVRAQVIINRCDLGDEQVEEYCRAEGIPVLDRLPWDRTLAEAYARGALVIDESENWAERFGALCRDILHLAVGGDQM